MHWSKALYAYIATPPSSEAAARILAHNSEFVLILDAYPKARRHLLVIPKRPKHRSIFDCTKEDECFLQRMHEFAFHFCKKLQQETGAQKTPAPMLFGFHALPSMQPLHLHCISSDFVSPCMSKKHHWNSFNSEFFVQIDSVLDALKHEASFASLQRSEAHYKSLLKGNLECASCAMIFTGMETLNQHLLEFH